MRWLPYAFALLGIVLSFLIAYILNTDASVYSPLRTESYHPWVALGLGIVISILIAAIIRIAQLANDRADRLSLMNEDLKREIAERTEAVETKQKLENALLQGQKLQAIGTLAGGIAHDFNNLLYAIIGYVEISREDVDADSIVHQNLGKVLAAAHRGQDLVARILAFSRRQHHHFDKLNLKETIEAALALLSPTIPASVMINFEPMDATILGNQTQIHQVLVNLINNAVDAMDDEGTITIKMAYIGRDHPILRDFPQLPQKAYCQISVSDTGHGMDKRTIERIFEPFYTTKEVGKGTGLGLSIVHSIIKDHDGEISVHSQLGKGTEFIILLPVD